MIMQKMKSVEYRRSLLMSNLQDCLPNKKVKHHGND